MHDEESAESSFGVVILAKQEWDAFKNWCHDNGMDAEYNPKSDLLTIHNKLRNIVEAISKYKKRTVVIWNWTLPYMKKSKNTAMKVSVRGKMILPPHGKEFFTRHGKQIFTSRNKEFFT